MGVSYNKKRLNVLLLGLEKSGKSTFLQKLLEFDQSSNNDSSNKIESTVSYNYCFKCIEEQEYDIWDVSGSSIFVPFWCSFYRNLSIDCVLYFINILDNHDNIVNSIKTFIHVVNEEELKFNKFYIIFNVIIENKKHNYSEEDLKEIMRKVESYMSIIRNSQVHDIDNRVFYFVFDISKIKKGETNTTNLLKKCLNLPVKQV